MSEMKFGKLNKKKKTKTKKKNGNNNNNNRIKFYNTNSSVKVVLFNYTSVIIEYFIRNEIN